MPSRGGPTLTDHGVRLSGDRDAVAVLPDQPMAYFNGLLATDLQQVVDLADDPGVLDRGGWWAVVGAFEGSITGYRFADVRPSALPISAPGPPVSELVAHAAGQWHGPDPGSWRSSLDRAQYLAGVAVIRERIAMGDVDQVNLCRMLSAPLSDSADPLALAARLGGGNPAPYQGVLRTGGDWVVTAPPELFLSRSGDLVTSSPIKGTTGPGEPFAQKDFPENVMITDLVRNDLGRVATAGSVVDRRPGCTRSGLSRR